MSISTSYFNILLKYLRELDTKNKNKNNPVFFSPKQEYTNYGQHRFGWKMVMKELFETVSTSQTLSDCDYILDDWFEKTFRWGKRTPRIPSHYTSPFITFSHDPVIPHEFMNAPTSQFMTQQKRLMTRLVSNMLINQTHVESSYLKCLIVLSYHHAYQLKQLGCRLCIFVMPHPSYGWEEDIKTIDKSELFSCDAYESHPRVFFIGWWLRKYDIFIRLVWGEEPLPKKYILTKEIEGSGAMDHTIFEIRKVIGGWKESLRYPVQPPLSQQEKDVLKYRYGTHIQQFVPSLVEYDEILKSSVVFIDVYATSANNVVLECIRFCTPLLACRHPAIIEYLGQEYPFYFSSQQEANAKISDLSLIRKTHEYLRGMIPPYPLQY